MSTFIRAKLVYKYYARLWSRVEFDCCSAFFPLRNINQYCVPKSPLHKYLIILIYKRIGVWVFVYFQIHHTIEIQVLMSSASLLLSLWTSPKNRIEYNKLVCMSTVQLWFHVESKRRTGTKRENGIQNFFV